MTDAQAARLAELLASGARQKQIAAEFGVRRQIVGGWIRALEARNQWTPETVQRLRAKGYDDATIAKAAGGLSV